MGERNLENLFKNPTVFKAGLLLAAFGGITDMYRQAWLGFGDGGGAGGSDLSAFLRPLGRMFAGSGGLMPMMMGAYLNELQKIIRNA
jgi:hypothetical protein